MSDIDTMVADQILVALRRIIRATDLHSRTLLRRFGITGPQLLVLRSIELPGQLSLSAIAAELSVSAPTAADVLRRLETKGLVERQRDAVDRRRVLFSITSAGREILEQAPPPLQESFTRALGDLPDWEQTAMLSALQRIVAMMEAEEIEASPVLATGDIRGRAGVEGEDRIAAGVVAG
ncbi:MAG: MarR family transcriptional regulator [Gemmatimonadetes bacterium]|nr:MarR family transcriptional regulator [Gemmatimonadota bacterium]